MTECTYCTNDATGHYTDGDMNVMCRGCALRHNRGYLYWPNAGGVA